MQIDKVFGADPKSIHELFLGKGHQGFYIPAYQREYAWDAEEINRLLDDLIHGIELYAEHDDAITFIGTVIAIRDQQNVTIKPYVHGHLPTDVMTVIDGQQRLTTIALLSVALHQLLSLAAEAIRAKNIYSPEIGRWIDNRLSIISERLKTMFVLDKNAFDPINRFYPKIIRAYIDQWSYDSSDLKYDSPVASFLAQYIKHCLDQDRIWFPKKDFKFNVDSTVVSEDLRAKHEKMNENFGIIIGFLKKLSKDGCFVDKKDREVIFTPLQDILNNRDVQQRLLEGGIESNVITYLNENGLSDPNSVKLLVFIRLNIIAQFLTERTAVTSVVATNETYAFDMFEALNTTGEPLTAFETFKPKVIDFEGLDKYESSESRRFLTKIDKILEQYKKADDKHKATSRILIPFRMLEEGEKLSNHLSEQRRVINKLYDKAKTKEDKLRFLNNFSKVAEFMANFWPDVKKEIVDLSLLPKVKNPAQTALCLQVLREANHNITIPILVRYYINAVEQNNESDWCEFEEAIKAVTAFFVLWRASRTTTDRIDSYYREVVKSGWVSKDGERLCESYCNKKAEDAIPSTMDLKSALKSILSEQGRATDIEEWVSRVISNPIYKVSQPLTKFFLLIASNSTVASRDNPGMLENAVADHNKTLDIKNWQYFSSVEHIWPQRARNGWVNDLDELPNEHLIGNLVLLPMKINASFSNRTWIEKKALFDAITEKAENERAIKLNSAKKQFDLADSTVSLLTDSRFMHQLEALVSIDEFDKTYVNERSKNLANIVWQQVSKWLEPNSD